MDVLIAMQPAFIVLVGSHCYLGEPERASHVFCDSLAPMPQALNTVESQKQRKRQARLDRRKAYSEKREKLD